jgi:hypothetical protein
MRRDLQRRYALCFMKVLRLGVFSVEFNLILAEAGLGGVAEEKKCAKSAKSVKSLCRLRAYG